MNQLVAHTIDGRRRPAFYDPSSPLGQGGAGIAFADKARPGYVIKLYKRIVDHMSLQPGAASRSEIAEGREKIEAMLQAPPAHQTASDGTSTLTQVAWPQELLLTADGRFVGFTMREVDFLNSVPLEQLFLEGQRSAKGLPQDFEYRLIAAQNLSSILDLVHRKGHAIVDLQPQNVRVYKKNGWVGLIDCDGYRISAAKTYHARFLRADFAAPELQRSGSNVRPDMGDECQDRFALALLIFSLLNDGLTPFNVRARAGQAIPNDVPSRIRDRLYGYGRTPNPLVEPGARASIHEHFPDFLRDLFDRAFLNEGANRPTAAEWSSALQKLLTNSSPCKKVRSHGNSVLAGKCMLCARQAAIDALSISAVSQVSYTRAAPQPVVSMPLPAPPPTQAKAGAKAAAPVRAKLNHTTAAKRIFQQPTNIKANVGNPVAGMARIGSAITDFLMAAAQSASVPVLFVSFFVIPSIFCMMAVNKLQQAATAPDVGLEVFIYALLAFGFVILSIPAVVYFAIAEAVFPGFVGLTGLDTVISGSNAHEYEEAQSELRLHVLYLLGACGIAAVPWLFKKGFMK